MWKDDLKESGKRIRSYYYFEMFCIRDIYEGQQRMEPNANEVHCYAIFVV